MQSSVLAAVLLAACARAVEITLPAKNDVVDLAAGVEVKWTTVSSDPRTAHLFLVNMAGGHTPYSKDLGEVDLTKGSITVKESVADDTTYQFNFQSVQKENTGILAQSQQFEAKVERGKEGDKGATTTKAPVTTASGSAKAESTMFSSVVTVSASGSAVPSQTKSSETANASPSSLSGDSQSAAAAVQRAGGMLTLVAAIVAVVA